MLQKDRQQHVFRRERDIRLAWLRRIVGLPRARLEALDNRILADTEVPRDPLDVHRSLQWILYCCQNGLEPVDKLPRLRRRLDRLGVHEPP